ncbi:GNAT family N-acetyltransferase [Candidatus Bathyarchaeota archaeon]|nr:GNAT family N-acetyltransferase [Candidatus Bathyarchaeota archaeon]
MVTYPEEFKSRIKLKNGTEVILRSIKPEDEMLWLEMFKSFSDESVWYRFFNVIKDTPHEIRIRYCNINYDNEIAIIAELQEEQKKMLGVVRFTLDSDKKSGELAFIVVDQWQGLGLGTIMVDHVLNICRDKKIEIIYSFMLPNNYRGIKFLKKMGFNIVYLDQGDVKGVLDLK